jgi:RND family efflux transporter MFP subunit
MRYTLLITPTLFLFAACGEAPPPEAVEVTRPVKTLVIEGPSATGVRRYPARIDAGSKAELAFRVPGKVQELAVKEGDRVEKGQVVASLDAKDYQIVVNDRQATYDNATKNFIRAQELIDKGHISKMDYDRLEAESKSARAALDAAKQDLSYTQLKAPFGGMVARRYIEQFEEVQAKQPVLDIQDVSQLEVKFDVPENQVRAIRREERDDEKLRNLIRVSVAFDDLPDKEFPLKFREIATKADAQTQTFQVTYTMDRLENVRILPGMTANVTVDLSRVTKTDAVFAVPASAIVGDYALNPRAWVVDEATMTVQPRPVKVGRMSGSDIEVLEGLELGERIVVAGTPFLVDGMKVTLLPDLEQAEPRQGE